MRRANTQMTDRLWAIHAVMGDQIVRAYYDFEAAHEADKPRLEKRLLNAIKKRSKYPHKPFA